MKTMGKNVIVIGLVFLMILGTASATASDYEYWDLHYTLNAPASINNQSKAVTLAAYGYGYNAKATSITGSYNRYVLIEGRQGFVINNDDLILKIYGANDFTGAFYTYPVPTVEVYFMISAIGNYCVTTGFISINSWNIYHNL